MRCDRLDAASAGRGRARPRARVALCAALLLVAACGDDPPPPAAPPPPPAPEPAVGAERLRAADPADWLSHGRTQSEQRYSPLDQINAENVGALVRVWSFDTGLTRGHEATPLVADGVLYLTGSWSVVFALDAKTGELLWKWDPKVDRSVAQKACCDVVNRGVALYGDRVFTGVLDGRLAALDAKTGKVAWEVVTVDQSKPYTITAAPRVVEGNVIIGNGGAEFGVRGYVSAYDADNGELVWRTYTVPGDPAKPFESPALEAAAKTWKGGEWWKVGGGGTAWDSQAYDPELGLLYVGTGNGSPWSRYVRSPGGGDNLYLSSILALDPKTGEIRWHYQTTPGDTWDFTATQHMILADLEIDGRTRKVIMQAPKNGFFYVLDRETGEFISADKFVEVTWADRIDENGRPVTNPSGDYEKGLALVKPTAFGGHNWQPMSYSPDTGLVYIPAHEIQGAYALDPRFSFKPGRWNTGADNSVFATLTRDIANGKLVAWDPVRQREAWSHPYDLPWNGGTLATAGNLVFQGTADGRFLAFSADAGRVLWEAHAGTGIVAAPITWSQEGVQYVTVVAGWGGAFALAGGPSAEGAAAGGTGRVLTFALFDQPITVDLVNQMLAARDPSTLAGDDLYHAWCARCHGASAVSAGVISDLRKAFHRVGEGFVPIVTHGLPGQGMPAFGDVLTPDEIREIGAFLEARAE